MIICIKCTEKGQARWVWLFEKLHLPYWVWSAHGRKPPCFHPFSES
jgi:hypothetical protein